MNVYTDEQKHYDAELIVDVIRRLNGSIIPVGYSADDYVRYQNLENMFQILDVFIDEILSDVLYYENDDRYDEGKAGRAARKWVDEKTAQFLAHQNKGEKK